MNRDDDTLGADTEADPTLLTPGRVFAERYEVQALLGRGGMGAVYRVHDRTLDEIVALKVLTLSNPRAIERFLREVKLARRVTHPNVARTHDLGEHAGLRFLTMEHVPGRSLDRVLEETPELPLREIVRLIDAIAAGLEAAHAAGVVHRDLKPANVLLAEDGRVVLTDFGIARATQLTARTHDTGALIGTPHYMAPEQVLGRDADARADIYALGLMLFELLTGRLPFEADTALAVAIMRLHEEPADPRSLAPVPDALAELVLACLAREPAQRPSSVSAVRVALAALGPPEDAPMSARPTPRTSTSSTANLYAPISPGRRALAVLPFIYRGDAAHDYLGEGLAEELIDVLSRTRGLRVLALGSTRRFAESRDAALMGVELAADAVVDGTVQLSAERVRITARLIETESGLQRWSERFDGRFEDVFTLQETMGQRIAEALRLAVDAASHRGAAPPEAIEQYLVARRLLRGGFVRDAHTAVETLERVLALAPDFTPVYPALAIASVRAWWADSHDRDNVRGERARTRVEQAVERAPDVAETHLARAFFAGQLGDYRASARALARALEIAPTLAEAHAALGELQLEAGRVTEGRRRLALADELDPSANIGRISLARSAALEGDYATADRYMAEVDAATPSPGLPLAMSHLRLAMWRGDVARGRMLLEHANAVAGDASRPITRLVRFAFGESSVETALQALADARAWLVNPRFSTLMLQIGTEVLAVGGAHEQALDTLEQAAQEILIDVDWTRRCPVIAPLRESPRYARALAQVEQRARAIWAP